jgi:hypothetical protein
MKPIFAPNFNPFIPGNEMVYVINYWDHDLLLDTGNYGPFYPKGLSFIPKGTETDEFTTSLYRLQPNSVVEKITKNAYDELIKLKKKQIAQLFIEHSQDTGDPFAPGRQLVFSLPPVGFDNKNGLDLENHIIDQIFGKNNEGPYSIFLPLMIPVVDNAGNIILQDDLYGTYCQFDQNSFHAGCGKCLSYEAQFMSSVGLFTANGGFAANRYTIRFFNHPELAKQKPKIKIRKSVPDCKLCDYYVVYCSSREDNPLMFLTPIDPDKSKINGLVLQQLSYVQEQDLPENAKFFETYEDALTYYIDTIGNSATKWLCIQKNGGGIGNTQPEYGCEEILESCIFAYIDDNETIQVYDTKSECEENCGKKWYCLEYECVRITEDDPSVEGLTGYNTQEECEQNCEIPSSSSSSSL